MTEAEYKAEIERLRELIRQLEERIAALNDKQQPVKCYLMERRLGRRCEGA